MLFLDLITHLNTCLFVNIFSFFLHYFPEIALRMPSFWFSQNLLFLSSFSTCAFSALLYSQSSMQELSKTRQNNYSQMDRRTFQDSFSNLCGIGYSCWRGWCAQKAPQPPLLILTEIVNQSPQLLQFTARDICVNWNQ